MALTGTVCRICSQIIEGNGVSVTKSRAKSHLMTTHKEEWQEFEDALRNHRDAVKRSREAMLSKAEELLHDPELIIPQELL